MYNRNVKLKVGLRGVIREFVRLLKGLMKFGLDGKGKAKSQVKYIHTNDSHHVIDTQSKMFGFNFLAGLMRGRRCL